MRYLVIGLLALTVVLSAYTYGTNPNPTSMKVEIVAQGEKNKDVYPIAFLDLGDGIGALDVMACGTALRFTVNTKTATPEEFDKFLGEQIDKACGK